MKELFVPKEAFDQKPKEGEACRHAKHPGYETDLQDRYDFHVEYCKDIDCTLCICYQNNKDEHKKLLRQKKLEEIKKNVPL